MSLYKLFVSKTVFLTLVYAYSRFRENANEDHSLFDFLSKFAVVTNNGEKEKAFLTNVQYLHYWFATNKNIPDKMDLV